MGQDISGACGQLVVNIPDKSLARAEPLTDIEDLVIWYHITSILILALNFKFLPVHVFFFFCLILQKLELEV